ncbi:hypothetical protein TH53_00345 [Pedobacter lusitanus]|uniref:SecDF P1 head subdomain domain-containing protein n=2 Tax=Pedobacter lusitanus TaxID=1503925 RepID=A0A0D0GX10_9SPHI|nr:hypothetical protein TH53_00345 [Pedobacter lusitanus]
MACVDNKSTGRQTKPEDGLISDAEHHIKDNPEIAQQKGPTLYTGWYYVVDSGKGIKRQLDKSKEIYFIDRHPIVTPSNFINLSIEENYEGGVEYCRLFMELDGPGSKLWAAATKKAIGKQLAFILDNRLLYVAPVFAQILNGMTVINLTNYSKEEFENFKTIIKSER